MTSPIATNGRQAIGLDVGGTKIAGGVVTAAGQVLQRLQVPTPTEDHSEATLDALLGIITELRTRHPLVEAVGVGAAGMIEWPNGYIRWAPNNAYRELPLQDLLAQRTGLPVVVENDANAAAWAEHRFGDGAGGSALVALTLGTGIGGGIIADGRLYRGRTGIGAEVGHLIVNPEHGALCGCGATGCLEAEASGTALGRLGREAARLDPAGTLAALAGGADQVTGETVFQGLQRNDSTSRSLFDRLGYWLGVGIATLVNILEPEAVVLSGGLAATGESLLEPTQKSFEQYVFAGTRRKLPPILVSHLHTDTGLVGAAVLALDRT